MNKETIPIYGNGKNVRDWIYVLDHINGLYKVLLKGKIGESYNIGTNNELQNIELCKMICVQISKILKTNYDYTKLIKYVEDRKAHDIRYAIDNKKIKEDLNFKSKYNFKKSLKITIKWYIENKKWLKDKTK